MKKYTAIAALLLGSILGTAAAEPPPPAPALTAADAEGYFDAFLPFALRRADIAGAVVVVVKDGKPLFEKGYGYADLNAGRRVDPQTTLFRPGSVTKLFTWTAVMQLVEAGKLDLDRDVNGYLDFHIPGKPITLRNLLTHTAGFEDSYKNLLLGDAKSTPSIEAYLKAELPPELFAPGSTVAYSNYGATLAGYIVQRVSGEPYATYIERHIFVPLNMMHSTFAQPVPASPATTGPLGYLQASQPPRPFEFISTVPAGALSTTGADMAHFMITHLESGKFGTERILGEPTTTLMHAPAYRPIPGLQAMSLGFYGEDRNGHRIIGHAGDLISFHADLHLLLDDHVGVFVAFNSLGKDVATSAVRAGMFAGFMDRYFPAPLPEEPTLATALEHGKQLVGEYEISRRVETSFPSLGNLLAAGKLTVGKDGTISLSTLKDFNGEPKHWREIAPFQWRQVNGTSRLAATLTAGRVTALASDDVPPIAIWQPVSGAHAASWNLPLLAATLLILTATIIAWPVVALVRRHYRLPTKFQGRALRLHRAARLVALLDLVFLAGWLIFLVMAGDDLTLLTDRTDPMLHLLQLVGALGLVGLIATVAHFVTAWRDPAGGRWTKLWNGAVVLACLGTTWFGFAYHLLGVSLKY